MGAAQIKFACLNWNVFEDWNIFIMKTKDKSRCLNLNPDVLPK